MKDESPNKIGLHTVPLLIYEKSIEKKKEVNIQ